MTTPSTWQVESARWESEENDLRALEKELDEIRRRETYLAIGQRLSLTGSFAMDLATGELFWSEETFRLLGVDRAQRPSLELALQRAHPQDAARVREYHLRALRDRTALDFQNRVVMPDGTTKHVRVVGQVFGDGSGKLELVGAVTDITAIERSQQELRESEARFRALADTAPVLIWMSGPDKSAEYFNKTWLDFRGRTLDQERGEGWMDGLHPEDKPRLLACWTAAFNARQPLSMEKRLLRADGAWRWVLGYGVPRYTPEGEFLGYIGTDVDITERKQAELALAEARAQLAHVARVTTLGELAASIAHEVNQPLAAVVTNAGAALRWLSGPSPNLDQARRALSRIVEEGNRADEVIKHIRALAKKSSPQKDLVDVNQTIRKVVALTRSEVEHGGVAVLLDLGARLPDAVADPIQLQQVVLNLIVNAIEAMAGQEQRREIRIGTSSDGKLVRVSVADTGPGLPPESADHVFDAFFSSKPNGMGMGLAICRSIIESHAGRLWVEANDPRGAAFRFTVPAGPA